MGKLTAAKARMILRDGSVRGNKLSGKQKRFFGAIAGGAKPKGRKKKKRNGKIKKKNKS